MREKKFDEGMINHFANFWILAREKNRNKSDTTPAKYFKDVPDAELKRALIERNLLDFRHYRKFITVRSEKIVTKIREKFGFPEPRTVGKIAEE